LICDVTLADFDGLWQFACMTLSLPQQVENRLDAQSAALHLAIGLFVSDEATLGQAAEVAGVSQSGFLKELGKRQIPIHYGEEDLEADLRAVAELQGE